LLVSDLQQRRKAAADIVLADAWTVGELSDQGEFAAFSTDEQLRDLRITGNAGRSLFDDIGNPACSTSILSPLS